MRFQTRLSMAVLTTGPFRLLLAGIFVLMASAAFAQPWTQQQLRQQQQQLNQQQQQLNQQQQKQNQQNKKAAAYNSKKADAARGALRKPKPKRRESLWWDEPIHHCGQASSDRGDQGQEDAGRTALSTPNRPVPSSARSGIRLRGRQGVSGCPQVGAGV